MPRLHLVRHAQAAAGWGHDNDPPLSKHGLAEAEAMADRVAPLGPLPLLTSPLQRARETAGALERRWQTMALVEPGVGEVPSPSEVLAERQAWLHDALGRSWPELGVRYTSWRTMATELLLGLVKDTVVVTHFVLINAAVGRATGDDRVGIVNVPTGGVVVLETDHHEMSVVSLPEAPAEVAPQDVL